MKTDAQTETLPAHVTGSRRERPILFSGPMVRAILAGRKTQTRRIVKPQRIVEDDEDSPRWSFFIHHPKCLGHCDYACGPYGCPYGAPGDRLWVRETWAPIPSGPVTPQNGVLYFADEHAEKWLWRPSIFMPRWASRITLEIVGVRVERLHAITEADAISEGVTVLPSAEIAAIVAHDTPGRMEYWALWESINGRGSWDLNPWVWVVEFKVVNV
jgi:hypothetical protein